MRWLQVHILWARCLNVGKSGGSDRSPKSAGEATDRLDRRGLLCFVLALAHVQRNVL